MNKKNWVIAHDCYLVRCGKPETYWFIDANGIKREFASLESMQAAIVRPQKPAKLEEEEITYNFLSPERKEILRENLRKLWEVENEAKKNRKGFVIEKGEGGKKILDTEDGYVLTYPVMGIEDLIELRSTFKEGCVIPDCVWNTACNTWGNLVLEFTHEDWVAEIQSQIDEKVDFKYVAPKAVEFKMRSYPIMEDFKWDDYRPWDKHPWATLDHLYCAVNHIDEEEVMVDVYKLDPAEFYCKWGFQVSMVDLPERRKITPSMLLKYENCKGIMHMTLRVDKNDFYGEESSYSRIQVNNETGHYEYVPENKNECNNEW